MNERNPFILEWEAVDSITRTNLKEAYYDMLKQTEIAERGEAWLHPEDIQNNRALYLPALKTVLQYYGEHVD